ncbi:hypothetical protein CC85DRAFT_123660 [Cutaneotrichosporon oleaginosum]|uniref:Uncharacterized protein n=1 Tax=Cutaneotrichosporon oleaginosum TaxID=879819 RepID=A0A0J1B196_9TREE|nr:uncharacterized protein CC85DRAFT_123660 [Cutaneotrichosporon oleaginosum]KLT41369.1 hypothetical protein CC85DRAFT_123660 [Cutaneotrichosporon oleaginosum]TXT06311.1 hypothetical protein COLE_05642 [Cutaneotrichosporon oleaginosum]
MLMLSLFPMAGVAACTPLTTDCWLTLEHDSTKMQVYGSTPMPKLRRALREWPLGRIAAESCGVTGRMYAHIETLSGRVKQR